LIRVFWKTDTEFRDYIGEKYNFNLQTIYRIIPVRDGDKSKVNPVLNLFKDILEQRKIDGQQFFQYFIQLILCHWYERYRSFTNIDKADSFDFAVRNAVVKYSALFYSLKQLNLLDMKNQNQNIAESADNSGNEFQKRIESFFGIMEYTEPEKAMFYLGRVLSSIASAQYKKKHKSKPVLNKINFNGMDTRAILRFSLDLNEKLIQYNIHSTDKYIHSSPERNFSRFRERFNAKNWPLTKEQNIFYLMAGYSFGLTTSNSKNNKS
jgi:CRISPR-associated protein Csh1